jgi:membrane-associated phospholipid phosphatase
MELLSLDYAIVLLMSIILIIGVYQLYFWCQRQYIRPRKGLMTFIDRWFTYKPGWVWIYSGLYYPAIIFTTLTLKDMRHFAYTAFSYFILLALQMIFFLFFPVESPMHWRRLVNGESLSEKFLNFVMRIDADSNCFPSMHVSVATLTALHLLDNASQLGLWVFSFPVLIALSSLYTKRHYFLDLIPGALLGWGVFEIYKLIYF